MTRYVLYGGKGGVGKTTCAAATGLKLSEAGHRTLVVSTDPAHSLSDVLETDLGGSPRQIDGSLWAVEADPEAGQESYRRVVENLAATFRRAGVGLDEDDVDRLFAAGLAPGSDEVAALEYFGEYDDEEWDRIVFDTAPTGHTLRLLTLPDVLQESLATAETVRDDVRRVVASARSMVVGPAAFLGRDDDDELATFRDEMARVERILGDDERTDFRVVLLPETLAIEETRRLVDRLRSFDVPVDTLVVNRGLLSVSTSCDRCQSRVEHHRKMVETIRRTFPGMGITEVPDLGPEATGRESLDRIGEYLAA